MIAPPPAPEVDASAFAQYVIEPPVEVMFRLAAALVPALVAMLAVALSKMLLAVLSVMSTFTVIV